MGIFRFSAFSSAAQRGSRPHQCPTRRNLSVALSKSAKIDIPLHFFCKFGGFGRFCFCAPPLGPPFVPTAQKLQKYKIYQFSKFSAFLSAWRVDRPLGRGRESFSAFWGNSAKPPWVAWERGWEGFSLPCRAPRGALQRIPRRLPRGFFGYKNFPPGP